MPESEGISSEAIRQITGECRGSGDTYFVSTPDLVDHFFRHEYGRLVATLSRSVGSQHIEDVEDAGQSALMTALARWTTTGLPENPPAWLFRVSQNNLLETLRRGTVERRIVHQVGLEQTLFGANAGEVTLPSDSVGADLLQTSCGCCFSAAMSPSRRNPKSCLH